MLLGLDLASRLTGWCCGTGHDVPQAGAWAFPKVTDEDGSADYGLLLATLDDYLTAAHGRFGFTIVAYEAPILIARRPGVDPRQQRGFGDTLAKLRLLYPLGAMVEFWCYRRSIPCYEVTVAAIKKEVTGNHRAEKADLIDIAEKCGLKLPSKSNGADDAADAFGAWLLLLRSVDKELSNAWDRKVWTPRGAML
jgi:hypothetical protein